jgi:ubiquinone/menaquinone biosynthesis C-methylase UbiE
MDIKQHQLSNEQSEFWSKIVEKYDRVVDAQIGPRTRSLVRDRVSMEDRLGSLVEFGCGTGFYTSVLASKSERVMATDLSPAMIALAKNQLTSANMVFQEEACQSSSLPSENFDTAFISLVIHFTEPPRTLNEMNRILKPGGLLIIANLDPGALSGLNRLRCLVRILYYGLTGYRLKPPKGFGRNILTEKQLSGLLSKSGFRVQSSETIRDASRASHIPVEYIRAVKVS